jgi:Mitochondrial ribosomal protein (VAR1)
MAQSFNHYISNKTNKLNKLSNNLDFNSKNSLNYFKNLVSFNVKGLNLYNKNLNSYISKSNYKNLVFNLKKDDSSIKKNTELLLIETKTEIGTETEIITNSLNFKNNIQKMSLNNYLNSFAINKIIYEDKKFNYVKNIDYKYNTVNNNFIKKIYDFLFYSFYSMNSLISKPIFEINNDKVIIHLFFYLFKNNKFNKNNTFIKLNNLKLNIICKILSSVFRKPVEFDLVRLYYPYFDSNIFVNLLSALINNIQIRIIMQTFFKKAIIKDPNKSNNNNNSLIIKIPSLLSGIKIRIGGRLMSHRIIPKQTLKIIRKGTLSKGKLKFLDEARYTNKNKRGAFTLTISIGHYLT